MQGIAITSTASSSSAATASAGAGGVGAGADDSAASGAGLFGAILAGQLKGKAVALRFGADVPAAGIPGEKALLSGKDGENADISAAKDILADIMALANSGMLPTPVQVQIPVQVQAVQTDALTVSSEGQALIAEIRGTSVSSEHSDKPATASRRGGEPGLDETGVEGEPVKVAADGQSRLAEIAGDGKSAPVKEPVTGDALKPVLEEKPAKDFGATLEAATASRLDMPPSDAALQGMAAQVTQSANAAQNTNSQVQNNAITPEVGSREWGNALGDKVTWMATQGTQVAELQLNPPNLGPLEVRLTVTADQQANVVFVSHQPAVREAIETALPRLREMLADSGIMLGNSMVGAESFQQQQQQAQSQHTGNGNGRANGTHSEETGSLTGLAGVTETGSVSSSRSGAGLVDMFV